MVDHTQSAVISASCLPMSIIIVGVGHEDFKVDFANFVGGLVCSMLLVDLANVVAGLVWFGR